MFLAAFISSSHDFTLHFHFQCSTRTTFDGNFDLFNYHVHLSYDMGGLHARRGLKNPFEPP